MQLEGTDEALNVGQLAGVYYYSDEKTIETCLGLYDQIMEAFSKGD